MDILSNEALLSWVIGAILILIFAIPYLRSWQKTQRTGQAKLDEAIRIGANQARMQHPIIDLSRCIGCGICTRVCPEGEVLGLVGGKAVLINGSKCVGHEVCMESCPVGGIEVGLGDISSREDIPRLTDELESNLKNVFIIGELGGLALIRNAVNQGTRVANTLLARADTEGKPKHPIIVIGAGPAGLACTITLQLAALPVIMLDQNEPGGTILQYPRRKLVLTQPIVLPGFGSMDQSEYSKEDLLEIWGQVFKDHKPDFRVGNILQQMTPDSGGYQIKTNLDTFQASSVVLALGRRGSPRKLNIPGEQLSKVSYKLIDAKGYNNAHILVVGGGDSAIEAAIGLGRQSGNTVTISYRGKAFTRIKSRNDAQVRQALKQGWIKILFESTVSSIEENEVHLSHAGRSRTLVNQYVFIFAGGVPPFKLMESLGIRFGTATVS